MYCSLGQEMFDQFMLMFVWDSYGVFGFGIYIIGQLREVLLWEIFISIEVVGSCCLVYDRRDGFNNCFDLRVGNVDFF